MHSVRNMMTSSNGNIFRVTGPLCGEFTGPGEFPTQRPVTRSFDVFFHLRLNKRLSKQPLGWWFETLSCSLWRHCNVYRVITLPQLIIMLRYLAPLQWRHDERDGVLYHRHLDYLLSHLSGADQRKHQSSASQAFMRGIHWWPVNSPYKGQWHGALIFSLNCAWINGWASNRDAGDLRRHRAHYDVIVMMQVK